MAAATTTKLEELAGRVERLTEAGKQPDVPGVSLFRAPAPTAFEATVYEPILCLILQGEKETSIGDHVVTLSRGQCVVVGHELPVLARVTKASAKRPYLSLVIKLDMTVLRSLYDEVGDVQIEPVPVSSLQLAPVDAATAAAIGRYLDLQNDPVAARVLLPLVQKELHFRLFRSKSGAMLRSLLHRGSHASNVARATRILHDRFRERLDVAELASAVGMSTSAFHKYFKQVTLTTPIQYQKNMRLTEARRLLRVGWGSVSSVAFEVGYESPSQFSREYARRFGAPPRHSKNGRPASQ